MNTLNNFFYSKAFNNSKLFRLLALCMLVALFGTLARSANADFRFTVSADNRPGIGNTIDKFEWALSEINYQVTDEGAFHVSVGDIDPPGTFHTISPPETPKTTYQSVKNVFGDNVWWFPVVGNHELPNINNYMLTTRNELADDDGTNRILLRTYDKDPNPPETNYMLTALNEFAADDGTNMSWLRSYDKDPNLLGIPPDIVNKGPSGCVETTYSFDYENAHFVVLNEYCDTAGDDATDGDIPDHLYNWLKDDLNVNQKEHIFIFGHEPAFPQNNHFKDSLNQYPNHRDRFWWNLLEPKGVMAYICGHTHWYSRYQELGGQVWQIDVGAAGVSYGSTDGYQTFLDVGVSDYHVQFRVWHGNYTSHFNLHQSWTVIKNQTISTTENFEDSGTITTGPNVTITPTGDVTLQYGERVILRNGFSVEDGGRLSVIIDPSTGRLP